MKDNELKPCPFCGGKAEIHETAQCWGHGEFVGIMFVACKRCGGKGQVINDRDVPNIENQKLLAIKAWNNRVGDQS